MRFFVRRPSPAFPGTSFLPLLLVLVLIAAACGSTVQLQDSHAGGETGMSPDGVAVDGSASQLGPDRSAADLSQGLSGEPSSNGSGLTEDSGSDTGAGTSPTDDEAKPGTSRPTGSNAPAQPGPGSAAAGPGVTDSKIYVGASFSRDAASANAAVGADDSDPGDARTYYNAVIKDLNARGGLAGHQVEPIYYEFEANSTASADSQMQAACTHWTDDNKVFTIFSVNRAILQQCAHRAGILGIDSGFSASTRDTFQRYPRHIEVNSVRLDRIGSFVVPGLHNQGYFDANARIGIVTWDDQSYVKAVETDFKPALARVGQKVQEVARVAVPQSLDGVGESQASISAAVLRFRHQNITHVMILDGPAGIAGGGLITLLFLQSAESQAYRPRYGFNTTNAQTNSTRSEVPEAQLEKSVGVTWSNYADETDQGIRPNPQRRRCLRLLSSSGVDVSNGTARELAINACSDLWFLEAAVEAGGQTLSIPRVMAGVDRLRGRFRSPASFGNQFSRDHRDGAALARNFVNDSGCGCYRYPGAVYRPR